MARISAPVADITGTSVKTLMSWSALYMILQTEIFQLQLILVTYSIYPMHTYLKYYKGLTREALHVKQTSVDLSAVSGFDLEV